MTDIVNREELKKLAKSGVVMTGPNVGNQQRDVYFQTIQDIYVMNIAAVEKAGGKEIDPPLTACVHTLKTATMTDGSKIFVGNLVAPGVYVTMDPKMAERALPVMQAAASASRPVFRIEVGSTKSGGGEKRDAASPDDQAFQYKVRQGEGEVAHVFSYYAAGTTGVFVDLEQRSDGEAWKKNSQLQLKNIITLCVGIWHRQRNYESPIVWIQNSEHGVHADVIAAIYQLVSKTFDGGTDKCTMTTTEMRVLFAECRFAMGLDALDGLPMVLLPLTIAGTPKHEKPTGNQDDQSYGAYIETFVNTGMKPALEQSKKISADFFGVDLNVFSNACRKLRHLVSKSIHKYNADRARECSSILYGLHADEVAPLIADNLNKDVEDNLRRHSGYPNNKPPRRGVHYSPHEKSPHVHKAVAGVHARKDMLMRAALEKETQLRQQLAGQKQQLEEKTVIVAMLQKKETSQQAKVDELEQRVERQRKTLEKVFAEKEKLTGEVNNLKLINAEQKDAMEAGNNSSLLDSSRASDTAAARDVKYEAFDFAAADPDDPISPEKRKCDTIALCIGTFGFAAIYGGFQLACTGQFLWIKKPKQKEELAPDHSMARGRASTVGSFAGSRRTTGGSDVGSRRGSMMSFRDE